MRRLLKSIPFVFLLLLFSVNGNAQRLFNFGAKAGVNFADYSGDMTDNSMKIGYRVGVTVDYRISRYFCLFSGVEISTKGTREKTKVGSLIPEEIDNPHKVKRIWNPLYLQIPLHVGYILKASDDMNFLVHVGPFVSYGIGGKVTTKIDGETIDKVDAFGSDGLLKRWDVGLGIGTGFEFRGIGVNFGYDLGFLKAGKDANISLRNNTAHITFGYRFFQ